MYVTIVELPARIMSKAFDSIERGLREAIEFANGRDNGACVFEPKEIDIKQLRQRIDMTQEEFASVIGISLGTLRHWERGDRKPNGPALVLLNFSRKGSGNDSESIVSIMSTDHVHRPH